MLRALTERRALSFASIFGTGADTISFGGTESGVSVNQDSALSFNALWACVRLLSGDISTLPVDAFRKNANGGRTALTPTPSWLLEPDPLDPSITLIDHLSQVAISLLLDGNAFVLCTPSVFDPVRLEVLNPRRVDPKKGIDGRPIYQLTKSGRPSGEPLTSADIVHIRINTKPGTLRGVSPVTANQEAIGIGIAAEKYIARFFGSGMSMQGFIEVPGEPTTPQLDEMRGLLEKRHGGWRRAHAFGFLTGGAKFAQTTLSPKDADLTGLLKFQLEQAARAYGIPPFMVGSQEPAGVAYASSVERAQAYIDHALVHYIRPIEAAYSRLVSSGADTYVKFNLNALLRGDTKSRYEAYGVGLDKKFLFIEDVWGWEELDPDRTGTLLETPNNNGPRETAQRSEPVVVNLPPVLLPDEISIPAPIVNVPPAEVHVAAPDLSPVIDAIHSATSTGPSTTDITARDANGRPTLITTRRGGSTVRKSVDYTDDGRVASIVEVPA